MIYVTPIDALGGGSNKGCEESPKQNVKERSSEPFRRLEADTTDSIAVQLCSCNLAAHITR